MIDIQPSNFLPGKQLFSSHTSSYFEAGRSYGKFVSRHIHTLPRPEIVKTNRGLELISTVEKLRNDPAFVLSGRNVLSEYLDLLYGYCDGTDIAREHAVALQAEIQIGCQTCIVKNLSDSSIALFHTEENFEDQQLMALYEKLELHPEWNPTLPLSLRDESLYSYTLVTMSIKSLAYTFFGYPELCFGGPAMSFNANTNTFMCVDTISPNTPYRTQALWANAVVSMMLLLGDIPSIRVFLRQLSEAHIYILNGYAVHMIDGTTREITSFEIGGDIYTEIPPTTYEGREYIAQANYPRSEAYRRIDAYTNTAEGDIWTAQSALQMHHREQRLQDIAKQIQFPVSKEIIARIESLFYSAPGDIETYERNPDIHLFTGLLSPYLAGYGVGVMTEKESTVVFGKMYPYVPRVTKPKLWYAKQDAVDPHCCNLYETALLNRQKKTI